MCSGSMLFKMRYKRSCACALIFLLAVFVRVSFSVENQVGGNLINQTHSKTEHLKSTVFQENNPTPYLKVSTFPRNQDYEIPESFKVGFYFFIVLSAVAMLFTLFKIYRMRLSRAERKYGVHSDRTTQELTPLPIAIEDDSDNDDHTLFDINRQVRHS